MDLKYLLVLFLVCFIPFIGYFANPLLAFNDSYAFLSQTCGRPVLSDLGSGFFKEFVLPLFPCNIFLIKLVLFGLYFVSILSVWGFARELVGEGKGFRVAFVSATLSPLLFFEAMKFENDIFGWCLCFLSFWVISVSLRPNLAKKVRLPLLFVACCLLFLASIAYIPSILGGIALVFLAPLLLVPIGLLIWLFLSTGIGYLGNSLVRAGLVSEEMLGFGVPWIALMLPFILDIPKKLRLPAIFLLIMGFVKAKFMLFAVPFLAFGVVEADEKFRHHRWWPNLFVVGFVFVCVFSFMAFYTAPNTQDFVQINEAIKLSQDLNVPLYNDWSIGWWVYYLGYPTTYRGGYPNPDWNNLERPFVALTKEELPCEKINKAFICK